MRLHEYQSKGLLARYGVRAPEGEVASSPEQAGQIAARLGGRVVVKAQVLIGGRGKAGGIRLGATPDEARRMAGALLGGTLKGFPIRQVLVERALPIARELYLGLTVDRAARRMALMASSEGGVDIEETARAHPEHIYTLNPDPFLGLRPYQMTHLSESLNLPRALWPRFGAVGQALYRAAQELDATLAEINPLVITTENELLALDAKILLDDSALYRHPDLGALGEVGEETPAERQSREAGIAYIRLDGQIGCMVNGAGLAMATMDVIKLHGGESANFLDIGGGAKAERVAAALQIILSDLHVAVILINIFGGITRCDEVAHGILEALGKAPRRVPLVIRLVGTNEAEGRRILEAAHLPTAATLSEGAAQAVALAKGAAA